MSFPSVTKFLEQRGVTATTATPKQLESATLDALELELPLGMAHLTNLATETRQHQSKWIDVQDPDSPLGRQIIRLMTDAIRPLMAKRFGIAFGFYNCCNTVCAPTADELDLSLREQIMCQNGELSYASC